LVLSSLSHGDSFKEERKEKWASSGDFIKDLHLSLHRVERKGERLGYGSGQADIGEVLEGREPISGSIPEFLQVHVN